MTGKIIALLFAVALTGTAGAAEVGGDTRFNAPMEGVLAAEYRPIPPPVADQTYHYQYGVVAPASSTLSWAHEITAFFDPRMVEKSCMATAVYFEARSESPQGQLAVAMVILNRVKASNYPKSICGVVYQNASRLNACQFSFACDGEPDLPKNGRSWETALAITALALADDKETEDEQMQIVSTATHYHADYVRPRWSRSLQRLTKIGHHIFYSQS